jgi:hypothetical protein
MFVELTLPTEERILRLKNHGGLWLEGHTTSPSSGRYGWLGAAGALLTFVGYAIVLVANLAKPFGSWVGWRCSSARYSLGP